MTYLEQLAKQAVHVEEGGPVSRFTASTVGRLNPNSIPALLMSGRTYVDPSRTAIFIKDEDKIKKHREEAEGIAKYDPEALKDTVVRLGGTNVIDDLLWKKNRGEDDPWHKRIGGRVFQNKKTGLISKVLGVPNTLVSSAIMPLLRGSHYNPYSDAIAEFSDEPAILQHELGHALDFNRLYGIRPGSKDDGLLKRQLKGLARDLYGLSYFGVPGGFLLHEARANQLSHAALKKHLGANSPEYREAVKRRWEVLPVGYGSYLAGAAAPFTAGAINPVVGMAIGKGVGRVMSSISPNGTKKQKDKNPKPKEKEEDQVSKAASVRISLNKLANLLCNR